MFINTTYCYFLSGDSVTASGCPFRTVTLIITQTPAGNSAVCHPFSLLNIMRIAAGLTLCSGLQLVSCLEKCFVL
jgi:hypothetical protein